MATRTIEVFNTTKRLLELITKFARAAPTDLIWDENPNAIYNSEAYGDISSVGSIEEFREITQWIRANYSEGEWRTLATDATISELENWLDAAPPGNAVPIADQEKWLSSSNLSGSASSNIAAASLGNKILGSSGVRSDEYIQVPDTTSQPGEDDMPGPDVKRGLPVTPPDIREGASAQFIGDDPAALVGTPKTKKDLEEEEEGDVEVEDEDPYDLGALVDEIGGLDYFTGPDWIISPEDIPRGLPEISGPMNVVEYMSMYEVSPSRAKELLRKTAGFAKYTKWDANWAVMTPEEQDRAIAETQHQVWIQARLFGIDVPENHPALREIALKIKRMNWTGGASDDRVREIFYNHKELLLKRAIGQHDVTVDKVKTAANNWMVSLSKEQRDKYAQDIELGVLTIEGLEQTFQDMAYKNYPTLRGVIDGGSNLLTYSDPYATGIEAILDREIDFNGRDKEMFDEIFMGSVEDDGVIRPKTWGEAKKYVRETGKYGWDKTPDAKAKYRGVGEVLLQKFGAVR
tara:strand:+ start:394 stop:1947 length:1554 start_codon:yes stop_codon:yes gene_type:complete